MINEDKIRQVYASDPKKGFKMLMDNFEFTQEEIAKTVGKSRPAITNALRLLNLPEDMQNMLERGEMTAGHARPHNTFKFQCVNQSPSKPYILNFGFPSAVSGRRRTFIGSDVRLLTYLFPA